MTYRYHSNSNFVIVNLIDNPIIAEPDEVSLFTLKFNVTWRPWIFCKIGNCSFYSRYDLPV